MNLKELVTLLNIIEQDIPKHNIVNSGMNLWPLIRLLHSTGNSIRYKPTNLNSSDNSFSSTRFSFKSKLKSIISNGFIGTLKSKIQDRKGENVRQIQPIDYLFILNYGGRTVNINGEFYAPSVNSFEKLLGKPSMTMEFGIFSKLKIPRYGKSKNIAYALAFIVIISEITSRINKNKNLSRKYSSYLTALHSKGIETSTNFQQLNKSIHQISLSKKVFKYYFRKYKPKVIFMPASYNQSCMGAILAAKDLQIKTVDIQHGITGKYHTMYTNWISPPTAGFKLLPEFYWTWGNLSKKRIEQWTKNTSGHRTIIGGNPWIHYCLNNTDKWFNDTHLDTVLKHKKYVILVALQYYEDFKNSCVIEAMKNTNEEYIWLIRMHPRYRISMEELGSFLDSKGCNNYEIRFSNALSIYQILPKVQYQVSYWSTTIVESLSFGIKNIVIHENGFHLNEEYIKKGVIKYTEDAGELINFIDNQVVYSSEEDQYILTDKKIFYQALKEINQPQL